MPFLALLALKLFPASCYSRREGIASFLRLYSLSGLPESHAACNLPLFVAAATILPTGNLFEV
jgi:hypothetical protein